jgi:hypothetical protein
MTLETMIREARKEREERNGNVGFSRRELKDGTKLCCQVRKTVRRAKGEGTGERIEWLINGNPRSKKTVVNLLRSMVFTKNEAIEALSQYAKNGTDNFVTIHRSVLEQIVEALIAG